MASVPRAPSPEPRAPSLGSLCADQTRDARPPAHAHARAPTPTPTSANDNVCLIRAPIADVLVVLPWVVPGLPRCRAVRQRQRYAIPRRTEGRDRREQGGTQAPSVLPTAAPCAPLADESNGWRREISEGKLPLEGSACVAQAQRRRRRCCGAGSAGAIELELELEPGAGAGSWSWSRGWMDARGDYSARQRRGITLEWAALALLRTQLATRL